MTFPTVVEAAPQTETTRPAARWTRAMTEFASTYADQLQAKGVHPEPMNEATALLVAGHIERLRAQIASRS